MAMPVNHSVFILKNNWVFNAAFYSLFGITNQLYNFTRNQQHCAFFHLDCARCDKLKIEYSFINFNSTIRLL